MNAGPLLTASAPAKINLHLHIIGKREDGYHLLDSLVCFANIADQLSFTPAHELSFTCEGPFANDFSPIDKSSSRESTNLVVRAAWLLADRLGRHPDVAIHLTKNLPLGSGIGGGSSDAAACLRGLMALWGAHIPEETLHTLATGLGSDVAVCLSPKARLMQGIGDILRPAPRLPVLSALLVNPGIPCPTPAVYKALTLPQFSEKASFPDAFLSPSCCAQFLLEETRNDMTESAVKTVPAIADVLESISALPGCLLSRLSGSGATAFGLFPSPESSANAAQILAAAQPGWWVRPCTLND
jgi:4-diphosphocytidyl-2-C-methyl-D-erythritol kinase